MATGSGDGRGEEGGVRGDCGDGSGARVVVGAAVTGGGASGESLAASEHAAATMIRKIGTNRDETTRVRLGISITYPRLYHSFARQRGPDLARLYRRLSLRDVFLSFAGYRRPGDPVHRAIASLSPSDHLQVRAGPNRWELLDRKGTVVGQLAAGFEVPDGFRCKFATVLAIVTWSREKSEQQYQDGLRCDEWEVVVPELVFEPGA